MLVGAGWERSYANLGSVGSHHTDLEAIGYFIEILHLLVLWCFVVPLSGDRGVGLGVDV